MAELDGRPVSMPELRSLALTDYGHFTSMRFDDQRVRGLALHLERLISDCRTVFHVELDSHRLLELIRRAASVLRGSFIMRVTVFDPDLDLGRPADAAHPKILITTRPAPQGDAAPMRLRTVRFSRDLPTVKHVGLFGSFLRRRWAQQEGFDDALFVHGAEGSKALISEGPTWNIGFYDGESVILPAAEVLPGVTIRLLRGVHPLTVERPVTVEDLPRLCTAFATNTSTGVRPISVIDGVSMPGDLSLLAELRRMYEQIPAERP
jgi:branched-subunit amino acid aminotransferase/4-amino-4-deoxychorismate lyase